MSYIIKILEYRICITTSNVTRSSMLGIMVGVLEGLVVYVVSHVVVVVVLRIVIYYEHTNIQYPVLYLIYYSTIVLVAIAISISSTIYIYIYISLYRVGIPTTTCILVYM